MRSRRAAIASSSRYGAQLLAGQAVVRDAAQVTPRHSSGEQGQGASGRHQLLHGGAELLARQPARPVAVQHLGNMPFIADTRIQDCRDGLLLGIKVDSCTVYLKFYKKRSTAPILLFF